MERGYDRLQVLEPADRAWTPGERLGGCPPIAFLVRVNVPGSLPWREDPKPYRVWVSEIMLQQTRVEAVKPYFERFMRELPAIRDLAEADEDKLMKLWEGLGYYSRIRNMKKAALILKEHWGGEMPGDYEEIRKLPGIGSYTAGAIASIAFGIPAPAVDGNVLRVVARITGSREDIGKQSVKTGVERLVAGVIPRERCGDFNQALIELGASAFCIPGGAPRCGECPGGFGLCGAPGRADGGASREGGRKSPEGRRSGPSAWWSAKTGWPSASGTRADFWPPSTSFPIWRDGSRRRRLPWRWGLTPGRSEPVSRFRRRCTFFPRGVAYGRLPVPHRNGRAKRVSDG